MDENDTQTVDARTGNKIPAPSASPENAPFSSILPPPWIELPGDVTANILRRLGTAGMLESAQRVCTTWWKVCQDPALWRVINLRNPEDFEDVYSMMCRRAVDLSHGLLTDLSIEDFGDDGLIHYIANRAINLRRLTIAHCCEISGTALSEAVKKLLHLEELHLIMVKSICAKDVEAIGISCPMLKSFSYHWSEIQLRPRDERPPARKKICNEYALAIGNTMPNLRHLQLLANWMTNEGLEAILDGCPHLESLDIRKCSGLDLTGALGERCYEQIQNVRGPSEAISNLEWLGAGGESSHVKWSAPCGNTSRSCECNVCYDYYYDDYDYERVTDLDLDLFDYLSA